VRRGEPPIDCHTPVPFELAKRSVLDGDTGRTLLAVLARRGLREGRRWSHAEAEQLYLKIPARIRAAGPAAVAEWLRDKDASHVVSRANGGADEPANLFWEHRSANRRRRAGNASAADVGEAALAAEADALHYYERCLDSLSSASPDVSDEEAGQSSDPSEPGAQSDEGTGGEASKRHSGEGGPETDK